MLAPVKSDTKLGFWDTFQRFNEYFIEQIISAVFTNKVFLLPSLQHQTIELLSDHRFVLIVCNIFGSICGSDRNVLSYYTFDKLIFMWCSALKCGFFKKNVEAHRSKDNTVNGSKIELIHSLLDIYESEISFSSLTYIKCSLGWNPIQ